LDLPEVMCQRVTLLSSRHSGLMEASLLCCRRRCRNRGGNCAVTGCSRLRQELTHAQLVLDRP